MIAVNKFESWKHVEELMMCLWRCWETQHPLKVVWIPSTRSYGIKEGILNMITHSCEKGKHKLFEKEIDVTIVKK